MSVTRHVGYGRFQLQDLLPGEHFARVDGTLAKVCEVQPYQQPSRACNHPYLPDHVLVWTGSGTFNAEKVLLHRTALVHAVTADHARRITARIKRRKGEPP
jgi:hypothetical protein